jgi:membrane protease YdiL (CAAX protease family)
MLSKLLNVMKRHPVVTFFTLAYGIAWGTFFILGGPFLFPFGPLLAALIVASVTQGRDGLKDLLSRCLRWRVGLKWYAAALLVPIAIALTTISLNILLGAAMSPAAQLAPWYSFFFLFPLALIDAPLGEDSGWRGYAMPRFPAGRSPLVNSLILGVLLAGWHLPIALSEPSLAAPYLITTIASAVVTNWVYYNAHESALLAILYHTSANTMGGAGLNLFQMFSGPDFVRVWWLLAAVNWGVVVILVLVAGPNLRQQPQAEPAPVVMET